MAPPYHGNWRTLVADRHTTLISHFDRANTIMLTRIRFRRHSLQATETPTRRLLSSNGTGMAVASDCLDPGLSGRIGAYRRSMV